MKKYLFILYFVCFPLLYSCGGSSESNSSEDESEYSEEADFSEIAGQWEVFIQGDNPLESSTVIIRISKSGDASVKQWVDTGYSQTIILEGEGYIEGSGNNLMITLTSGQDSGTQIPLTYRNDYLITSDGQTLRKKLY